MALNQTCFDQPEKTFSDRVGVKKTNAPVDNNKRQRQYWVVHESEPEDMIEILLKVWWSYLWHLSKRFFFWSLILSALKDQNKLSSHELLRLENIVLREPFIKSIMKKLDM